MMILSAIWACTVGGPADGVRINELQSSNHTTVLDEDGEPSDWVELHNPGAHDVMLTGWGLSDDSANPYKWTFPFTRLAAGQHLVVFASNKDRDALSGPYLHTNFKISSKGESLLITDAEGRLVDRVDVGRLPADVSWGLTPSGDVRYFNQPSPGDANAADGVVDPFAPTGTADARVRISEVLASNRGTLVDADGDYGDWIELHNRSETAVSLADWTVSDDPLRPTRWALPDQELAADGRLLLFASGKNRRQGELHANFKLATGDQLVLVDPNRQVADTLRIEKPIPDVSVGRADDGDEWLFYLIPTPGQPNHTAGVAELIDDVNVGASVRITELAATANTAGQDWVELTNTSAQTVSLAGWGLSDEDDQLWRWTFPDVELGPGGIALVRLGVVATHEGLLEAEFGIESGEELLLTHPMGRVVDRFVIPKLRPGLSAGRDGLGMRGFYTEPTPGEPNLDNAFPGYAKPPVFGQSAGMHDQPLQLVLEGGEAQIRYTLTGSEPNTESALYVRPLEINETTVVRAMAFEPGLLPSDVVTATYLVDVKHTVPVVSLVLDPALLNDPTTGLFEMGPDADPEFPFYGANFYKPIEVPQHFEMFESDGRLALSQDAGFKVFGGRSRANEQKSIQIVARSRYGKPELRYPFFPEKSLSSFPAVVLRAAGQDVYRSRLRDVLGTQLVKDLGIETLAYRPVVVYLNGEYWGLYNLREKVSQEYLAANAGIDDPSGINIVFGAIGIDAGSTDDYQAARKYFYTHDMAVPAHYAHAQTLLDVPNFIDYQLAQIYMANVDNGNIRRWNAPGTPLRWILYDLDGGFSTNYLDHATLAFVTDPEGTGSGKRFPTTFLVGMLRNPDFRKQFIARAAHHLTTTYDPDRVIAKIDQLAAEIEPEMAGQTARWGGTRTNVAQWEDEVERLRTFARKRPALVAREFQLFFALSADDMKAFEPTK